MVSAPTIDEAVGREGQIRGGFTADEASELATLLRYMHKPAAELATAAVGEADGGDASNESDES